MACTRKSSAPHFVSSVAKVASIVPGSVTSQWPMTSPPMSRASGSTRFLNASPFDLDRLARRARSWRAAAAAAVIVAFVAGAVVGWMAHGASAAAPSRFDTFTGQALDAHKVYVVEVRHPVEVTGGERPHLIQWLSKRLDYELRIPDLESSGLKLVGGRLRPGPFGPAAFCMYEGPSGERFTIYYARTDSPQTAMRYRAADRFAAIYWVERGLAYVVSGPLERERLLSVAQAAYDQIDKGASQAR